jgi:hypothetical protein
MYFMPIELTGGHVDGSVFVQSPLSVKMKVAFLACLLASLSCAFAFVPAPVKPMRAAVTMSAAKEAGFGGKAKAVIAGLTAPIIASAPVWATEGTGEVSYHSVADIMAGCGSVWSGRAPGLLER